MNKLKVIKEGKKVNKKKIEENTKEAKKKAVWMYIVPLVAMIIIAIIYILTQMNLLLIPFGALMLLVLFGSDSSSRTCPNCKKWNSVIWQKTERINRKTSVTKKGILNKNKQKAVTEKITRLVGKCKDCNCEFETEKGRLI